MGASCGRSKVIAGGDAAVEVRGEDAVEDASIEVRADAASTDVSVDAVGYPACTVDILGSMGEPGCVLGPDGTLDTTGTSGSVTVVSVDDVAADGCLGLYGGVDASVSSSASGPAKRLILRTESQQQWTVYVRIPGLPSDLVKVGDQLDFADDASATPRAFSIVTINQTLVLSRAGRLVLFSSSLKQLPQDVGPAVPLLVPMLDAFGIAVEDGGATCGSPLCDGSRMCAFRGHQALVTLGAQQVVVPPAQTAQLASLSFSVLGFVEQGCDCDGFSTTRMSGFMTGP